MDRPIIIVKKKGGHGHHGGAWKIAYADLVTAMMAFFMVMWLLGTAETPTRKAIANYFRQPGIFSSGQGDAEEAVKQGILPPGLSPAKKAGKQDIGNNERDREKNPENASEEAQPINLQATSGALNENKEGAKQGETGGSDAKGGSDDKKERYQEALKKIKDQITREILSSPDIKKLLGNLEVKVSSEGLSIEIMDEGQTSMFNLGGANILPGAQDAFKKIVSLIKDAPFPLEIIGHTDANPFKGNNPSYSNWELSSDRANAARRLMESLEISKNRFNEVIGRADQDLKVPAEPGNPSNRRITVFMRVPRDEIKNFPELNKDRVFDEKKEPKVTMQRVNEKPEVKKKITGKSKQQEETGTGTETEAGVQVLSEESFFGF